jgi:signal transduction histidine kinase
MAASRSIRFKISALLVVPLITLAGLWVFATVLTTRDSFSLIKVQTLYTSISEPGQELNIALQHEHLLSAEYMVSRTSAARAALDAQRGSVDRLRQSFRRLALSGDAQDALTEDDKARLDDLLDKIDDLDAARAALDGGGLDLTTLSLRFGQVPDAMQRLVTGMTSGSGVGFFERSRVLGQMAYAETFLARERALAAGVLGADRSFTQRELRTLGELATTRRFLFTQALANLDDTLRPPFQGIADSGEYAQFEKLEDQLLDGDPDQVASHDVWLVLVDKIDGTYRTALTSAQQQLTDSARPEAIRTFVQAGVTGLIGLVAVAVSVVVSLRVGRGLTRELAALRAAAVRLATERLPGVVERLRRGEEVDVEAEAPPIAPPGGTTEVGDVAGAFSGVQHTAVETAVEQARLREGVAEAFRNLARRNQSLLQRQLRLLDEMQRAAEEPEALENLFKLDHLTTRMRRHAEGLIILSGARPGRTYREPVPVDDVLRAAVAEVEDYTRVRVNPMPDVAIPGGAVADIIHLFAELVENAAVFSPPNTEVTLGGEVVARGFAVDVEDRGLGLSADELDGINRRLASPPDFDPSDTDRLGLFVVARLAARHGLMVQLRSSPFGGTTAVVLIPDNMIIKPEEPERPRQATVVGLPRRNRQASLSSPEAGDS